MLNGPYNGQTCCCLLENYKRLPQCLRFSLQAMVPNSKFHTTLWRKTDENEAQEFPVLWSLQLVGSHQERRLCKEQSLSPVAFVTWKFHDGTNYHRSMLRLNAYRLGASQNADFDQLTTIPRRAVAVWPLHVQVALQLHHHPLRTDTAATLYRDDHNWSQQCSQCSHWRFNAWP